MIREDVLVGRKKAHKLFIPKNIYYLDKEEYDIDHLNIKVFPHLKTLNPVRGDFVSISDDGCFMFNGDKLVNLHYDYINPEFEVINEFPIDYWSDVNNYNDSVWFNPDDYLDQLRNNEKVVLDSIDPSAYCLSGTFVDKNGVDRTLYYYPNQNIKGKHIWGLSGDNYPDKADTAGALYFQH
jgi:hypothetical protein